MTFFFGSDDLALDDQIVFTQDGHPDIGSSFNEIFPGALMEKIENGQLFFFFFLLKKKKRIYWAISSSFSLAY